MGGVVSEDPGRPTAQAQDLAVVQAGILVRDLQHLRTPLTPGVTWAVQRCGLHFLPVSTNQLIFPLGIV